MLSHESSNSNQDEHGLKPFSTFLETIDKTACTGWRWRQRGWIKTITIAGRLYVTNAAIAEFHERAARGEFEKVQRVGKIQQTSQQSKLQNKQP